MFQRKWFKADVSLDGVYVRSIYLLRIYDGLGFCLCNDGMAYTESGDQWLGQDPVDSCSEYTETEDRYNWMEIV